MKKLSLFIFLLLSFSINLLSQNESAFYLSNLSAQDTLLAGWKMHGGDDPRFAAPAFDDSKWPAFDPGIDIQHFKILRDEGICWIRLHVKLDSATVKGPLTAWVFQYCASEIYLDGKLIKKYGAIGKNSAKTVAFSPSLDLFNLPLKPGSEQVISVRLAYQSGLPYASPYFTPLAVFSMYANNFKAAFDNTRQNNYITGRAVILCGVFTGMAFIVSLIYLFYFLFNRKEKVHLYYSISTAFFTLLFLCFTIFVSNIESVALQTWFAYLIAIGFVTSSIFMLLTIYTLYNYRPRLVFKVLVCVGLAGLISILYSDIAGFVFATNIFMGICTLEGIRASAWAIRNKKKGVDAILYGLILAFVTNIWSALLEQTSFISMIMACLSIVLFPLGMSVFLAIQHAITNQVLTSSLKEVQTLSAQNILKEQEKQQLLSNQNEILEQQVTERTAALKQSIQDLQSTQSQLIQSEKMASLGELTAGIAHEIQNPLNFVNNFSDINQELLLELKEEADKGNLDEVKSIASDVVSNEAKINHHGKRADAIVKGMLQHSRKDTGVREPTDIQAICDEYLRLSYHGLRARDKSFNADFKTDFDPSISKISVVAQDFGRVLLNIFNNAFYATNEKKKKSGESYKPLVRVTTRKQNQKVQILIQDNGEGIPKNIIEKIFQPFFTTKPTGQGTGLGLSLSYDIIKAQGGEIRVETDEQTGTSFIIELPA